MTKTYDGLGTRTSQFITFWRAMNSAIIPVLSMYLYYYLYLLLLWQLLYLFSVTYL